MKDLLIVRGNGRVIKNLTEAEAIEELKKAQAEGDRFASVWGAYEKREELEKKAGYKGASAEEIGESLKPFDSTRD